MAVIAIAPEDADFADAYQEGDPAARWRSAPGHSPEMGARSSGSSLIEVPVGCRLPRHTDSAEEAIVVTAGTATVIVGDDRRILGAGGLAVVPVDVPHEVHNAGEEPLSFLAIYAAPEVVTRDEVEVQPDGSRERQTVG